MAQECLKFEYRVFITVLNDRRNANAHYRLNKISENSVCLEWLARIIKSQSNSSNQHHCLVLPKNTKMKYLFPLLNE